MTVTQTFLGRVSGPIAGRDVLVMDAAPLTEWEVQNRFRKATGIDCCKETRMQIERLLDEHGFTHREIRRAHEAGSLKWDRDGRVWVATPAWIDMGAAYVLFGLLTVMFLLSTIGTFVKSPQTAWIVLALSAAFYLAVLLWIAHMLVLPQRTARRVVQLAQARRSRGRRRGATTSPKARRRSPSSMSTAD